VAAEAALGTLIIDTECYNTERRDEGSMMGTDGQLSVDLTPLVKLCRDTEGFRFHVNSPLHWSLLPPYTTPLKDPPRRIEDHLSKVEIDFDYEAGLNVRFHMTQEHAKANQVERRLLELCVE
jgi:hypothetical protein